MKSEVFPAWLYFPNELRVRCRNCGTWKWISFNVDLAKYKPSPEKPYEYECEKCHQAIKVDRVWFARKGMKRP